MIEIDTDETVDETPEALVRLHRDIRKAARMMSHDEARYLVDTYYSIQDYRKASGGQQRALSGAGEPHEVITWLNQTMLLTEKQIKTVMNEWTDSKEIGVWLKSITGIGPIIAAGLIANDRILFPTVGHLWSLAGLDPTQVWIGREQARSIVSKVLGSSRNVTQAHIIEIARLAGRRPDRIFAFDRKTRKTYNDVSRMNGESLVAGISIRPWNDKLRLLTWKVGESFYKFQNNPKDIYGKLIVQRKEEEWQKNERGVFSVQAQAILRDKNIGKETDAYPWYAGCYQGEEVKEKRHGTDTEWSKHLTKSEPGSGTYMLPPAHIHSRAKRWGVKLFLSHYHEKRYRLETGTEPPKPYVIERLGHVHMIPPPD